MLNGQPRPLNDAKVDVTDDGLLRGDGTFEVIRLYGGRPFALADHLARFTEAVNTLQLDPRDVERIRQDVAVALELAGGRDALLRVVLTRNGTRILLLEQPPAPRDSVRLAVEVHEPTPLLRATKTLSYAVHMHAIRLAADRGYDDMLFVRSDGTVLEASRSAFFWVEGGRLWAPPLSVGILDSITRRRIVDLEPVTEKRLTLQELAHADEVLIADTVGETTTVAEVEGVGTFAAEGPVTQRIAAALRARIEDETGAPAPG